MPTISSLVVTVLADTKQFQAGMAQAQAQTQTATGSMSSSASKFGTVASLAMATAGVAVLKFGADAVNAASDQGEALNKAQVVFGNSSKSVTAFANTAAQSFGITKTAALEAAGGFGSMLQTAGLAEKASADMSVSMVKLAGDMASFNNQDPSEMLERLRSGLAGEAEPLRQFGVFLSEARVKTEAYGSGIAKVGTELTEAQKVQARYSLILQDTTKQQGDFGRTLETSLPNQMRVAKAAFVDLQAEIGTALLPAMTDLLKAGSDLLQVFGPVLKGAFELVGQGATSLSEALNNIIAPVQWLSDHIPGMGEGAEGTGVSFLSLAKAVQQLANPLDKIAHPSHMIPWVNWKAAVDTARNATEGQSEAVQQLDNVYGEFQRGMATTEQAVVDMGAATEKTTEELRDQRLAILALSNSFLGILDSANQVSEAQRELNRLEQKGKESTKAYEEAVLTAVEAQFGLEEAVLSYGKELVDAGEKQRDVIGKIKDAAREFGIQGDVVKDIIGNIRSYISALNDIPSTVHTSVTIATPSEVSGGIRAQHGFHGTVSRPTLILAGEAGRERVDISPGGGHGGGVTVIVNGWVGSDQQLAKRFRDELLKLRAQNATTGL